MSPNFSKAIEASIYQVEKAVLGKSHQVKLALSCLLAGGHLLIEDLPGLGKTTLAHSLAHVLGLKYSRVQLTSDMLPADILGVSIYDQKSGGFTFHQGPVFTELMLADELNRATPKTQSALLEAMAERQVTIEGQTRSLPDVFFVIATQNPLNQSGTYPLPESQLDRFLMLIELGYPDTESERSLLEGGKQIPPQKLNSVLTPQALLTLIDAVKQIAVSGAVLDYVQRLIAYTRESGQFDYGLSTRAALGLLQAAKAWALVSGRDYVLPDDIQAVLIPVIGHRLIAVGASNNQIALEQMLMTVPVMNEPS